MGARLLGCMLVTILTGAPGADAAHEWRGYWGGPSTFEVLTESLPPGGGRPFGTDPAGSQAPGAQHHVSPKLSWFEFAHRQPFSLPGIRFDKARWRTGLAGLEVHLGWLRGPAYQEWHVGVGGLINRGSFELHWGGRVFGLQIDGAHRDPIPAATILGTFRPPWLARGGLTAGVVDLGFHPGGTLSPVFVMRAGAAVSGVGFLIERCALYPARSETTLLARIHLPAVALVQGFRWATGEGLVEAEFSFSRCAVEVGGCWHPDLGWTPRFGFRLLATASNEGRPR